MQRHVSAFGNLQGAYVSTYSLEIPLMIQIIVTIIGRYNSCNQYCSKMQLKWYKIILLMV
jgi:hypothetical protein